MTRCGAGDGAPQGEVWNPPGFRGGTTTLALAPDPGGGVCWDGDGDEARLGDTDHIAFLSSIYCGRCPRNTEAWLDSGPYGLLCQEILRSVSPEDP